MQKGTFQGNLGAFCIIFLLILPGLIHFLNIKDIKITWFLLCLFIVVVRGCEELKIIVILEVYFEGNNPINISLQSHFIKALEDAFSVILTIIGLLFVLWVHFLFGFYFWQ